VPIFAEEKVPVIMDFLVSFAETVATMGLERARAHGITEQLQAREAELQKHREGLEQMVADRTAELEELTDRTHAQVREEATLGALTTSLQGQLSASEVAHRALSAFVEYLDAPSATLYVLEADGRLHRRAAQGLSRRRLSPWAPSLWARAASARRPDPGSPESSLPTGTPSNWPSPPAA
jgi:hypothetical protein